MLSIMGISIKVAGLEGLEPPLKAPKASVLPLHQRPNGRFRTGKTTNKTELNCGATLRQMTFEFEAIVN